MSSENIKLQPAYDHDGSGVIPYPLFINPDNGIVERAHPAIYADLEQLIGFVEPGSPFDIVVTYYEWAEDQDQATGLSPVFKHKDGTFNTHEWVAMNPEKEQE